MMPMSLLNKCAKFIGEFQDFHLIQNEEPLPKNILLMIFKEPIREHSTDHQKIFEEIRLVKKRLSILYKVLKSKGMLKDINDFFEFCHNRNDLRFLLASTIHDKAIYRLEKKYKVDNLSECQIDPESDLGKRILAFVPRKLMFKRNCNSRTQPAQNTYWSRFYARNLEEREGKLANAFHIHGVITKVLIKTRSLQNTTFVQGLRIYLNDGRIQDIGILAPNDIIESNCKKEPYSVIHEKEEFSPDLQTFEVPRGQWLHNVKIESDSYVKKLEFFTNTDEIDYNECESFAAGKDIFVSSEKSWFLSGMQGNLWIMDEVPFICNLQFRFDFYRPDISYYEKLIKLNSEN